MKISRVGRSNKKKFTEIFLWHFALSLCYIAFIQRKGKFHWIKTISGQIQCSLCWLSQNVFLLLLIYILKFQDISLKICWKSNFYWKAFGSRVFGMAGMAWIGRVTRNMNIFYLGHSMDLFTESTCMLWVMFRVHLKNVHAPALAQHYPLFRLLGRNPFWSVMSQQLSGQRNFTYLVFFLPADQWARWQCYVTNRWCSGAPHFSTGVNQVQLYWVPRGHTVHKGHTTCRVDGDSPASRHKLCNPWKSGRRWRFLSTPVHMHSGLLCITFCLSVCGHLTKTQD